MRRLIRLVFIAFLLQFGTIILCQDQQRRCGGIHYFQDVISESNMQVIDTYRAITYLDCIQRCCDREGSSNFLKNDYYIIPIKTILSYNLRRVHYSPC